MIEFKSNIGYYEIIFNNDGVKTMIGLSQSSSGTSYKEIDSRYELPIIKNDILEKYNTKLENLVNEFHNKMIELGEECIKEHNSK